MVDARLDTDTRSRSDGWKGGKNGWVGDDLVLLSVALMQRNILKGLCHELWELLRLPSSKLMRQHMPALVQTFVLP